MDFFWAIHSASEFLVVLLSNPTAPKNGAFAFAPKNRDAHPGAGSGLLSLMAAKLGAESVLAIEAFFFRLLGVAFPQAMGVARSQKSQYIYIYLLPEFMNFKLFGKTILVVIIKFELFLGHPLSQ